MTNILATTLRIGTRRSALALRQSESVADVLRAQGHGVDLVEVVTEGDRSSAALSTLGGTGVFVAELRERLLAGEVDLAVHSLKDLPTTPADGLVVAAIPPRADARDALVGTLSPGARVGTGSPRRAAQLRAMGRDLDVVPIRGNVDTRLRKVADGEYDAIVVAAAGLARLGRLDEASELLDPDVMMPAPGQGALAVECRAGDEALVALLANALDDTSTRAAVSAERTVLAALEAGCSAPVGALAAPVGDQLQLRATVVSIDGTRSYKLSIIGPLADGERLGHRLAADLLDAGAAGLIGESIP